MRQAAAPSAPASVRATQPTCISTLTHDAEDRESKGSPNSGAAGESTNNLKFFDQGLSNDQVERRAVAKPIAGHQSLCASDPPCPQCPLPRDRSNLSLDCRATPVPKLPLRSTAELTLWVWWSAKTQPLNKRATLSAGCSILRRGQ